MKERYPEGKNPLKTEILSISLNSVFFALIWHISNSCINNSQGHMDLLDYTALIYTIVKFHVFPVVETFSFYNLS